MAAPKKYALTPEQVDYLLQQLRIVETGEINTLRYNQSRSTWTSRFDAEVAVDRSISNVVLVQTIIKVLARE